MVASTYGIRQQNARQRSSGSPLAFRNPALPGISWNNRDREERSSPRNAWVPGPQQCWWLGSFQPVRVTLHKVHAPAALLALFHTCDSLFHACFHTPRSRLHVVSVQRSPATHVMSLR